MAGSSWDFLGKAHRFMGLGGLQPRVQILGVFGRGLPHIHPNYNVGHLLATTEVHPLNPIEVVSMAIVGGYDQHFLVFIRYIVDHG